LYKSLNEVLTHNGNPQEIGKAAILPSSYTGGPRYMQQEYQDAIAVMTFYQLPDRDVRQTSNIVWNEALLPQQSIV
jgi:hypothetical protein